MHSVLIVHDQDGMSIEGMVYVCVRSQGDMQQCHTDEDSSFITALLAIGSSTFHPITPVFNLTQAELEPKGPK